MISKYFHDELNKIAGVGWDLHGYHRDPELPTKQKSAVGKYYANRMKKLKPLGERPKVKKHSWFARTFLRKPSKEMQLKSIKEYDKKKQDIIKALGPEPLDDYDFAENSRIKTKFDKDTNYKLNMHIDYSAGKRGSLQEFTTDHAYSDKNKTRNISKSELRKIIKAYKKKLNIYKAEHPNDPYVTPGGTAFIQKAEALLKSPNFKFARLEYE